MNCDLSFRKSEKLHTNNPNLPISAAVHRQCLQNEGVQVDVRVRQQLPEDHIVVQVIAEDRCDERQWRVKLQGPSDVLLYILGRRCRQGQTGNPRQASAQISQFEVVWPKVVSPLGDAVSLVHSQVRQQAAGDQAGKAGLERGRGHHLGSNIEQLQLGAAAPQVSQDQMTLACRQLGVDGAGGDVQTLQVVHLVLCRHTHTHRKGLTEPRPQTALEEPNHRRRLT